MKKSNCFLLCSAVVLLALLMAVGSEAACADRADYDEDVRKRSSFIGRLELNGQGLADLVFPIIDVVSMTIREAISRFDATVNV